MNEPSVIEIRNCLDRRFQRDGDVYTWRSTVGKFAVTVAPLRSNVETDFVRVAVFDCLSDLEVDDWTHSVRCTVNWRERLQELVGKAIIRAQHRPRCPNCTLAGNEGVPLLVRTSVRNKTQFFGCANYGSSDCRYTVSLDRAFDCETSHLIYCHQVPSEPAKSDDKSWQTS